MLSFPLHNAALDLKGKPPEELPHGLLTIPEKVRELVERERVKLRPEMFERNRETMLNLWTVGSQPGRSRSPGSCDGGLPHPFAGSVPPFPVSRPGRNCTC